MAWSIEERAERWAEEKLRREYIYSEKERFLRYGELTEQYKEIAREQARIDGNRFVLFSKRVHERAAHQRERIACSRHVLRLCFFYSLLVELFKHK